MARVRYFVHKGLFIPMFAGPGWPRTKKRRAFKKRLLKKVAFPEPGKMAWYVILSFGSVYEATEPRFIKIGP